MLNSTQLSARSVALGPGPFSVTCTDDKLLAASELGRYSALLRGAGYRVLADPEDDDVLEVWPGPIS